VAAQTDNGMAQRIAKRSTALDEVQYDVANLSKMLSMLEHGVSHVSETSKKLCGSWKI